MFKRPRKRTRRNCRPRIMPAPPQGGAGTGEGLLKTSAAAARLDRLAPTCRHGGPVASAAAACGTCRPRANCGSMAGVGGAAPACPGAFQATCRSHLTSGGGGTKGKGRQAGRRATGALRHRRQAPMHADHQCLSCPAPPAAGPAQALTAKRDGGGVWQHLHSGRRQGCVPSVPPVPSLSPHLCWQPCLRQSPSGRVHDTACLSACPTTAAGTWEAGGTVPVIFLYANLMKNGDVVGWSVSGGLLLRCCCCCCTTTTAWSTTFAPASPAQLPRKPAVSTCPAQRRLLFPPTPRPAPPRIARRTRPRWTAS